MIHKNRRKTVKSILVGAGLTSGLTFPNKWIEPVVKSVMLPAHAQSSPFPPPTQPPVPPAPPTGCSDATCTANNSVGSPTAGGRLSFDGSNCDFIFSLAFPPDENQVIGVDNNSAGSEVTGIGSTNWSVSGISLPDQLLGPLGSGTASRTFTATSLLTGNRFEICLTVTRVGDAADTGNHTTYDAIIGPI